MTSSKTRVFCFDSPAPSATRALAVQLGRAIGARGLALGLIGPLGSGKTVFVKGLAEGLGVDPRLVSSPTFVIAQQYAIPEGPELLHHLDFYRLASEAELEGIGFLDLLGPGQVVAVEWLDRFPDALGGDRLEVVFASVKSTAEDPGAEPADATTAAGAFSGDAAPRRLVLTAFGDESARVLQDLESRWSRLERERGADRPGESDGGARSGRRARPGPEELRLWALLFAAGGLALAAGSGAIGSDFAASVGFGASASESDAHACSELGPAPDAWLAHAGWAGQEDGLGPLAVACLEESGEPGARSGSRDAAEGLDGMARLLAGLRIDVNRASARLLEVLPGIGPGRAAAIVEARETAPFTSTPDLERARGIGPKLRAGLEPFIVVDPEQPAG